MSSRTDDAALALDDLLVEGALGPAGRLLPLGPAARAGAAALRSPAGVASRAVRYAADLGRIMWGARPVAPHADDPRYADAAWSDHPVLSRLFQAHRHGRQATLDLVDDLAGPGGIDEADAERLRFAVTALAELSAPGSNPLLRPHALREAVATRGAGPARTARALVEDLRRAPRVPGARDRAVPGVDTATAPGAVVWRTPLLELLHYLPATERVNAVPVLVVPGFVNRFHLVDLAPDRSLVRRLVADGRQVLAVSWRRASDPDTGLDAYAAALAEAVEVCGRICRADGATLLGFSTGGLLAAGVAARVDTVSGLVLAGIRPPRPDGTRRAVPSADRLTEEHALLCPDELFWPAWGRRYLSGEPGPLDPLRAWNLDTLDVPAALVRDLTGGTPELLGAPVDLGAVTTDSYVVSGLTDRVGSWQEVYGTTGTLGGTSRFVLVPGSTAAAVGYGSRAYAVGDEIGGGAPLPDPEGWLDTARTVRDTWWADLSRWLGRRSGGTVDAPPELGGRGFHPIHPAPGTAP